MVTLSAREERREKCGGAGRGGNTEADPLGWQSLSTECIGTLNVAGGEFGAVSIDTQINKYRHQRSLTGVYMAVSLSHISTAAVRQVGKYD